MKHRIALLLALVICGLLALRIGAELSVPEIIAGLAFGVVAGVPLALLVLAIGRERGAA